MYVTRARIWELYGVKLDMVPTLMELTFSII